MPPRLAHCLRRIHCAQAGCAAALLVYFGALSTCVAATPVDQSATGTINVQVQSIEFPGVHRAAAEPPLAPTPEAVPQALVRLRASDGAETDQATDDQGFTTFTVPADQYLVYLPSVAQTNEAVTMSGFAQPMPDGTPALAWSSVIVNPDQPTTVSVTLTITLMPP